MNLCTTQKCFENALVMQNKKTGKMFEHLLCANRRIPARLAVEIYRNNTRGARIKALQEIYPVLEKILGEQCFYQMAHDYALDHPSNCADLNLYGERFSVFLEKVVYNNSTFSELLYICDLAKLEWYYHVAYYANDDVNHLVGLKNDAGDIALKTSRSLSLMQSVYPIHDIWQAHKINNNVSDVSALTEMGYLMVYRNKFKPEITQIDIEDWQLLTEIMKTTTMQALAEFSMKMELPLDKRLPALIQRGWVTIV